MRGIDELKDYLPRVLEESPDALIITGPDGRILYWNRSAEELYGYRADEVTGRSIKDLYPPELRDESHWWRKPLRENKPLRNIRTKICTKEGKLMRILLSLSLLRSGGGEPIAVVGISRDVTRDMLDKEVGPKECGPGRKREFRELQGIHEISDLFREEVELDEVSAVLAEKIAKLMDVEQCNVVLYDKYTMEFRPLLPAYGVDEGLLKAMRFSLTDTSSPLDEWTGTEPLVSNNPQGDSELLGMFTDHRERNILLAKLLVSGEFLGILRLANKRNGKFSEDDSRLAEIIASRLGAALHTMALFSDLKEHAKQLEEKSREVESFVYAISHDLKAPIISVQGYASALLNEYSKALDDEARFYVERIKKNTELMDDLISDLLELSRVGRITQPFEGIDLNAVLRDLCQESTYKYKGLRINVMNLPVVKGEKNRIIQVFSNLIDNAAKYMGDQEKPLVEVGCEAREKEWKFFVRDNGAGIAPEYLHKVFQPFYRGPEEKTGQVEGTGLGLAIVKKIVEYHGGRIWAESKPGEGSVFYFTLPR